MTAICRWVIILLWTAAIPAVVSAATHPTPVDLYRQIRVSAQLLTNATATGNGVWMDANGLNRFLIIVRGITTATVEISISNDLTEPLATDHGVILGAPITADGFLQADVTARWVKARVSAYTSGTINAVLQGAP